MPNCQLLHYLQMAAEKVCKAYLYSTGVNVGYTHAVVKKHLPAIVQNYDPGVRRSPGKIARLKQFAHHVELLAPALEAEGASPDNAEYPWQDRDGSPVFPLDFEFGLLQDEKQITTLLKIIRTAAEAYVLSATVRGEHRG